MSGITITDLRCDAEGCLEWVYGGGGSRVGDARDFAKRFFGWRVGVRTSRGIEDYCPRHREGS